MKNIFRSSAIAIAGLVVLCVVFVVFYEIITQNNSTHKPKAVIILKSVDPSISFWSSLKDGANAAAKEFGMDISFEGTISETSVDEQISIIDRIIKTKPNAILLAADDYNQLVSSAERVHKEGIKLITIDSDVNSNIPISFIATNNTEAGKKAGNQMLALLRPNSSIAIMSYVKGSTSEIEREKGSRQSLDQKMLLYNTVYCDGSQAKANQLTKELLKNHPDIRGIVALNEPSTIGVAQAIKELNLGGRVKIVGIDCSLDEVKFLESGIIDAVVVQNPFNIGYRGVEIAFLSIKGKKVDKRIYTESVVITKKNMYSIENEKLLFPFIK